MAQQKKKDIADFFRPFARYSPQKRRKGDFDDENDPRVTIQSDPSTPGSNRTLNRSFVEEPSTPSYAVRRTLATPKSGRSISIPIRSPCGSTASTHSVIKQPLFCSSQQELLPVLEVSPSPPANIPSSNHTIYDEDGKTLAVQDSDESDDSLESVSGLIGRKKDTPRIPGLTQESREHEREEQRRSLLSLFTAGRSEVHIARQKRLELQRRERANKVDLSRLFDDERKEAVTRNRIAQLNAVSQEPVKIHENSFADEPAKIRLSAILTENSVNHGAAPELSRILHAVDRTGVLATEKSYSFFDMRGPIDTQNQVKRSPFPESAIPSGLWKPGDMAACTRAFLSGFMTELAAGGRVSDSAVRWVFDSVCNEQQETIAFAYLNFISAASPGWTRVNISPEDVQTKFRSIGTLESVLHHGEAVVSAHKSRGNFQPQEHSRLLSLLRLFSAICQDMDFASSSKLCSILCRLALDDRLMTENRISQAANHILDILVNLSDQTSREHVHERMLEDLSINLQEPDLQARFLRNFFVSSGLAVELRARLATAFLLGPELSQKLKVTDTAVSHTPANRHPLSALITHISSSPDFKPRTISTLGTSISYSRLHALAIVLDAAIGDGRPPVEFMDRHEEDLFNFDVDQLSRQIHDLYISIPDSGASHMTRTEAKNALLDLRYRLLWAVRTRRKKKRHVFDASGEYHSGEATMKSKKKIRFSDIHEVEEEGRKKDFIARFLNRTSEAERSAQQRPKSLEGDGVMIPH